MTSEIDLEKVRSYFAGKLEKFGTTPRGVDWNSIPSQECRFDQLARIILKPAGYSLLDYGSGFGSLYDYLQKKGHSLQYTGFDIVEAMVQQGISMHAGDEACSFTSDEAALEVCDYAIASGIFNIKLDTSHENWTKYVIQILTRMNSLSTKGFAFNLLTSYSDADHKRPDLYYADPCFYFDYCKRNFARNVAILHDYGLYDFTILVRKELD